MERIKIHRIVFVFFITILIATTYIWSGAIASYIQDGISELPALRISGRSFSGASFQVLAVIYVVCNYKIFESGLMNLPWRRICLLIWYLIFIDKSIEIPSNLVDSDAIEWFVRFNYGSYIVAVIFIVCTLVASTLLNYTLTNTGTSTDMGICFILGAIVMLFPIIYYETDFDFPANIINTIWG